MKPLASLLAAALLLLPACTQGKPTCTPGPWQHAHGFPAEYPYPCAMSYERTPDKWVALLHDACRRCAAVEFRVESRGDVLFLRRTTREQADAALQQLLPIDRWYTRMTPPGLRFGRGPLQDIRFLDSEGETIFRVAFAAAGQGYLYDGTRYLSLWEFFASWLDPARLTTPTPR